MSEVLRPLTLGEILDHTIQLYRRNFWLFAGIAALPFGVIFAMAILGGVLFGSARVILVSMGSDVSSDLLFGVAVVVALVVAVPICLAASVFSYAGIAQATVSVYRGEKLTIRAALAGVTQRFWSYLWYFVLKGIWIGLLPALAAGIVASPLIFFAYSAAQSGGGAVEGVGIGALIVLLVLATICVIFWLAICYSLGLPACVVEQMSAWQALERSWKLSQGTRGRIFVMYLLVAALSIAAAMFSELFLFMAIGIGAATGGGGAAGSIAFLIGDLIYMVVNFTLQTILAPFSYIALVLFYFDQRIRKEGYDIEWMMAQAGLSAQPTPDAAAVSLEPSADAQPAAAGYGISVPPAAPGTVEE
jgi:ABC-type multidrug transport system fused ATPase/permease subunit